MPDTHVSPRRHLIGRAHGVEFDVVVWDGAHADVAFSVACMFKREPPGAVIHGGLLHLDQALGGALTELRSRGDFRAEEMETLLVTTPPVTVRAGQLLIIGLGDPKSFSAGVLERAIRVAMREAIRAGAPSAAFAPSLLDAGVVSGVTGDGALAMLQGALGALAAEIRLAELGLSPSPTLTHWSFDAGATHLDSVSEEFSAAFAQLTSV
jgi:hypothetical protein